MLLHLLTSIGFQVGPEVLTQSLGALLLLLRLASNVPPRHARCCCTLCWYYNSLATAVTPVLSIVLYNIICLDIVQVDTMIDCLPELGPSYLWVLYIQET